MRAVVDAAIREVIRYRDWRLGALNVRSTHVHVVVSARCPPEKVMNDFKAYGTRALRREKLVEDHTRTWSFHGSTRYLNTEESVAAARHYTLHEQGDTSVIS
jgi:REP element-mobilizing transposase RayT